MKWLPVILSLFISFQSLSQTHTVTGKIVDENNHPLQAVEIIITNHTDTLKTITDKEGNFSVKAVSSGLYYLKAIAHGYQDFLDSFDMSKAALRVGVLHPVIHELDEVK